MRLFRVRLAPAVAGLLLFASAQAAAQLPSIQSATYVGGLNSPVGMVQDPSDPAVQFVVQQGGLIRVIRNGALQGTNFLNLTASIASGGERGLLGLAFPSDYARTGRFYVNFTRAGDGHTVVARFLRSAANPLVADPNSRFDLLWPAQPDMATANGCDAFSSTPQRAICQPFSNHNGGKIAFGAGRLPLHRHGRRRLAATIRRTKRRARARCSARCCASTSACPTPTRAAIGFPPTTRSSAVALARRRSTRSGRSACATRGASASTRLARRHRGDAHRRRRPERAARRSTTSRRRLGGRNYGWRLREGGHDFNAGHDAGLHAAGRADLRVRPRSVERQPLDHRRLCVSRHRARRGVPRPLLLRRLHLRPDSPRSHWPSIRRRGRRPRPTSRITPPPSTRPAASARSTSTPTARSTS